MNMSVLKLLVGIFIWIIWRVLIRHSLFCGLPRKIKFSVWRLKRESAGFSIDSRKRTNSENQSARVHFFEIKEENLYPIHFDQVASRLCRKLQRTFLVEQDGHYFLSLLDINSCYNGLNSNFHEYLELEILFGMRSILHSKYRNGQGS